MDLDMDAAYRHDRRDGEVGRPEIVSVGEERGSTERRCGMPTRKTRGERLAKRIRVRDQAHGPATLEDRFHPGVDDDGLDAGGDNGPNCRPIVVRTSPEHSQERQHDPDQPEITQGGGRVEHAIGEIVSSPAGEILVDALVELGDSGMRQGQAGSVPAA